MFLDEICYILFHDFHLRYRIEKLKSTRRIIFDVLILSKKVFEMERLQKILASCGVASRRESEKLILAGRVKVNGKIVTELGLKFSTHDRIEVDGKLIETESKVYFILNKPRGYLSTAKDDRGRKIILDLFPQKIRETYRLFPVGRLDFDSEGILLVTNDGELMQKLTHPKFFVEKTYRAKYSGNLDSKKIARLENGIELEDGKTAPARIKRLPNNFVEITIHEGRNRQIRRMLAAVGCEVESLERIAFAGLTLNGIARGEFRTLSNFELETLQKLSEEFKN